MRRALAEGASGFLLKDAPASELAEAIRTVVWRLRGRYDLAAAAIREGESPLTPCEHEVLACVRNRREAVELAIEKGWL
jgi:two-component system response regulator DesR